MHKSEQSRIKLPMPLPCLAFIASMTFIIHGPLQAAENTNTPCNIHESACTRSLNDCTVTLDIRPKPVTAMKDLEFSVTISGKTPSAPPVIDLGMPGMKMGPNRVRLTGTGSDTFIGKGIIVRCPSGKRTWMATVTIPGLGSVKFQFDVVYE